MALSTSAFALGSAPLERCCGFGKPRAGVSATRAPTASLGMPDHAAALEQHARYCLALQQCGLEVVHLPPDLRHPDSTFVEDTAIVLDECALLTRPGAKSRQPEVESIAQALFKSWFIDFDPVHAKQAGREPEGMDAATAALDTLFPCP